MPYLLEKQPGGQCGCNRMSEGEEGEDEVQETRDRSCRAL